MADHVRHVGRLLTDHLDGRGAFEPGDAVAPPVPTRDHTGVRR